MVCGNILDAAGKQMEEAIRAQGGEATYVHLAVTREADEVEAVGTAVNRYGTLDIPGASCRHWASQGGRGHQCSRQGPPHGGACEGGVCGHDARRAGHAPGWRWLDGAHLVELGPGGYWAAGVHCVHRDRAVVHQGHCDPARP